MNYREIVLNELLNKYERSTSFQNGTEPKPSPLSVVKVRKLREALESPEEKASFMHDIAMLEKERLIQIEWVKNEKNNLPKSLYLLDRGKAYLDLHRKPKADAVQELTDLLADTAVKMKEGDLKDYVQKAKAETEKSRKIPKAFFDDPKKNEELMTLLIFLSGNNSVVMERVISTALYGNSKYFEKELKSAVISILGRIDKENRGEEAEETELLAARGIVRWPELFEFCGNISFMTDEGKTIVTQGESWGSIISYQTVEHIHYACLEGINTILFIENKANYLHRINEGVKADELVVFLAGQYSPARERLFKLFAEGKKPQTAVYEWSDIDVGGFQIFTRLKDQVFPDLLPYYMDVETLQQYRERTMALPGEKYRKLLENMLKEEKYAIFFEVIEYMLENNVRLEQENLLL